MLRESSDERCWSFLQPQERQRKSANCLVPRDSGDRGTIRSARIFSCALRRDLNQFRLVASPRTAGAPPRRPTFVAAQTVDERANADRTTYKMSTRRGPATLTLRIQCKPLLAAHPHSEQLGDPPKTQ